MGAGPITDDATIGPKERTDVRDTATMHQMTTVGEQRRGSAVSDDTTEEQAQHILTELLERNGHLQAEALEHVRVAGALRAKLEMLAGRLTSGSPAPRVLPTRTVPSPPTTVHGLGSTPLSRRRLLALTSTGIVTGAVASSVMESPTVGAASPFAFGQTQRHPVGPDTVLATTGPTGTLVAPLPTGVPATDTANLLQVLGQATPGTSVVLQCLAATSYVVDQELPIPPGVRLTAQGATSEGGSFPPGAPGGYMATLSQSPGSSLLCTVASAGYLAGLYGPSAPGKYPAYLGLYNNGTAATASDGAVEIDHIAFDGKNGGERAGNTVGHAIVLFSSGSRVHDCYIFDTPQIGIQVADANHAGTPGTGSFADNRIVDNKFFNNGRQAIVVQSTPGTSGCIDGYLTNNVIVAPSKTWPTVIGGTPNLDPSTGAPYEAVRLEVAAGWWVANNHPYQVPGTAWYLACIWGLHFVDNSTDDFGAIPLNGVTYVGYDFYLSAPVQNPAPPLHPAFINGNQLSAYEGFNTNNHNAGVGNRAANATNAFLYYRITMQAASQQNPMPASYVEHSDNSAHQDSPPAQSIPGATVTSGASTITFPVNVTTLLQPGMNVSDATNPGLIPANTFIGAVSGSSIALVNAAGQPVGATGPSSAGGDTIAFPAPLSVGWTYVNQLAGSTLVVSRTNEIISPSVAASPAISGPGSVSLIDPANFASGIRVSGLPTAGQTIVATSASTAVWGTPPPPAG